MNSKDLAFELVDGEVTLFPTNKEIETMIRTHNRIDGLPILLIDDQLLLQKFMRDFQFSREHDDFALALRKPGCIDGYIHGLYFRYSGRWIRVTVGNISCVMCGWEGISADPTDPTLYYGSPDYPASYKASFNLPVVDCPNCASRLPGRPIWIGQPR